MKADMKNSRLRTDLYLGLSLIKYWNIKRANHRSDQRDALLKADLNLRIHKRVEVVAQRKDCLLENFQVLLTYFKIHKMF